MIGLLTLICLAGKKDATISYETVAKPVGAVLADLSPKIGIKLNVTPEASQEIVLISVHDVTAKDLMDRLATVTSCEWAPDGDGYTLKASQAMRTKEQDYALNEAAKKIKVQIDKRIEKEEKAAKKTAADKSAKEDDDTAAFQMGPFGSGGPDEKAITALLAEIDPAVLARIGPNERGVWATNNANQMQQSLGGNSASVVQEWIAKHNESVKDVPATASAEMDQVPKALRDMLGARMAPVKEPIAKALLTVQHGMLFAAGGLQIELRAYSAQGKVLLQGSSMLDSSALQDLVQAAAEQAKGSAPKKPAQSDPIVYSEDSQELQKIANSASKSGGLSLQMPAAFRTKLAHPELKDPLAYVATDCLLSYAKSRGREIIADVPDDAFENSTNTGITAAPTTVADVQAEIDKGDTLRLVEDGKFLLFQPENPEIARQNRVNRPALRTLLAAIEEKLVPSLDDVAEYALTSPPPTENPLSMTYVMLFTPSMMGAMMLNGGSLNWDALRFYGSLEPIQRQALRSGGSYTMSVLTEAEQQYAAHFLFSGQAQFTAEGAAPTTADPISAMMSMFMGSGPGSDFHDEPTEVMPTGLTGAAVVNCGTTTEPIVYLSSDGTFGQWAMGPQELSLFTMIAGFAGKAGQGGPDLSLPKDGLLGERAKLKLTFHVGGKMTATCTLLDPNVPKGAPKVTLADLPPDFKSQVDAQSAILQKGILGSLSQMIPAKPGGSP